MLTTKQRAIWCNALRSGNYLRCSDSLQVGESYCALGLGMKVLGMTQAQLSKALPADLAHRIAVMNDARELISGRGSRFVFSWDRIARYIENNVPTSHEVAFIELSRTANEATIQCVYLDQEPEFGMLMPPPKLTGLDKVLNQFKSISVEA